MEGGWYICGYIYLFVICTQDMFWCLCRMDIHVVVDIRLIIDECVAVRYPRSLCLQSSLLESCHHRFRGQAEIMHNTNPRSCLNWYTGWWFGTFFIFHNIWDNPSHWLIFFKMVETTNHYIVWCTNLGLSENGVYPVTAILIRMMMNEWMQQRPGTVCSDEPRILQSSKYDWMIWLVPTS